MLEGLQKAFEWLIGLDADTLSIGNMVVRVVLVYVAALIMVRLGEKRFLGRSAALDVIVGIMLGSVVSRAITGSADFFPAIAAGFALVGMHWLFAVLAFRSDRFGSLIKGDTRTLVKDGEIIWDNMRKSHIGRKDLMGRLRLQINTDDLSRVHEARLERSGNVSVIEQPRSPRVVDVDVKDGVQTIRIKVE